MVIVEWFYDKAVRKSFEYEEAQLAAHSLNLTLQALEANSPSAIDAAFVRMASDQAQALMIFSPIRL